MSNSEIWRNSIKKKKGIILKDLKNDKKREHWMWYVFPTRDVGRSQTEYRFTLDQNTFNTFAVSDTYREWLDILGRIARKEKGYIYSVRDLSRMTESLLLLNECADNSGFITDKKKNELKTLLKEIDIIYFEGTLLPPLTVDVHSTSSSGKRQEPLSPREEEDTLPPPVRVVSGVSTASGSSGGGSVSQEVPPPPVSDVSGVSTASGSSGGGTISSVTQEVIPQEDIPLDPTKSRGVPPIDLPQRILVKGRITDRNYTGKSPWGMLNTSATDKETVQGYDFTRGDINIFNYYFCFLVTNCYVRRTKDIMKVSFAFVYGPNVNSTGTAQGSQNRTLNRKYASAHAREKLGIRPTFLPGITDNQEKRFGKVREAIKQTYLAAIQAAMHAGCTHLVCCYVSGGIYTDSADPRKNRYPSTEIQSMLFSKERGYRIILQEIYAEYPEFKDQITCVLTNFLGRANDMEQGYRDGVDIMGGDSLEVAEQIIKSATRPVHVAVMIAGNAGRPFGSLGRMDRRGLTKLPPYTLKQESGRTFYHKTQEEDVLAYFLSTMFDIRGRSEDAATVYNYIINGEGIDKMLNLYQRRRKGFLQV